MVPLLAGNGGHGKSGASKGAISQLQEFVQAAKAFPMPPSCPVLQWTHDTRILDTNLEFRATVSFLLDGVPHHIVGAWKASKKLAQRDVSERALGLFVGQWGELVKEGYGSNSCNKSFGTCENVCEYEEVSIQHSYGQKPVQDLENYCSMVGNESAPHPQWTYECEHGRYRALVEVVMFGIPHTFPGNFCESQEFARADAARRVLWYLQRPGYEDLFEPDIDLAKTIADKIPEPPSMWGKEEAQDDEKQQLADRKTLVMRVQNRLQQAYARKLETGTSVWYWTFERDMADKHWPPNFRASVTIPLAGRRFDGEWTRGQREAQLGVCAQIAEFLDVEFARTRGG